MVRKVTIARFEEWRARPENIDAFYRLLEGADGQKPLRFRDACVALNVPYTLMHALMKATPELKARYDAVRAANADQFAHEAVQIADGADEESKAGVMKAKLQVDTRLALASKWDRDDYGDKLQIEKNVSVSVDAGLLGTAADLLRIASTPERVVEGETLTLPAPKSDGSA